jgi:hypothetical protein
MKRVEGKYFIKRGKTGANYSLLKNKKYEAKAICLNGAFIVKAGSVRQVLKIGDMRV